MSRLKRAATLILAFILLLPAAALADQAKKLYDQGKAAEARENYEVAYDLYSKAFDLKPADISYKAAVYRTRFMAAASYVHRGQKLRDDGKLEDALVLFEKAYMIDPASFIAQQEIRKTKAMIDAKAAAEAPSRSPCRRPASAWSRRRNRSNWPPSPTSPSRSS